MSRGDCCDDCYNDDTEMCDDRECECHYSSRYMLGPFKFIIDTSKKNGNSRAIMVVAEDGAARDGLHPHVNSSGKPCWGGASIPVADAWGRRDWESLVRLILTWATRYNHNSPHFPVRWYEANVQPTEATVGWCIPQ
jgi:hypothetical protein